MAALGTDYSIQPLTADTWDAFAGLVERHNGILGGCWCLWFHPKCAERERGYEGNRALKKQLVEAGEAHAAWVMLGDESNPSAVGRPRSPPHARGMAGNSRPCPRHRL